MKLDLQPLLSSLGLQLRTGAQVGEVLGVTADSRAVKQGFLFVAVEGLTHDGHAFIDAAIGAGATAVLAKAGKETPRGDVTWLETTDPASVLGELGAAFYGYPSGELSLVGITGTNGKTTVATLCYDLFTSLGYKCGLIGTIEVRIAGQTLPATHTTPDALAVQRLLAEMVTAGCAFVFMEVSSHALVQQRVAGCQFAGGVFTNISHDHLDYHGDMKSYISAKKLLFDGLGKQAFALVNIDDKRGKVMLQNTAARRVAFALRQLADYKGRILDEDLRGLHLLVNQTEVYTRLAGAFNAYNFLAAYGVAMELGQQSEEVLAALSALPGAAGRLEIVTVAGSTLTGVVDYAHTPDALKNVLTTLQSLRRQGNQLITVFGCGGDRDADKRPRMGAIAAELSDHVIITDDNPRSEEPAAIREEIEAGIPQNRRDRVLEVGDRRQAIKTAVKIARNEDVILVAGKGHETYQETKGTRTEFDDRVVLREYLRPASADCETL